MRFASGLLQGGEQHGGENDEEFDQRKYASFFHRHASFSDFYNIIPETPANRKKKKEDYIS